MKSGGLVALAAGAGVIATASAWRRTAQDPAVGAAVWRSASSGPSLLEPHRKPQETRTAQVRTQRSAAKAAASERRDSRGKLRRRSGQGQGQQRCAAATPRALTANAGDAPRRTDAAASSKPLQQQQLLRQQQAQQQQRTCEPGS